MAKSRKRKHNTDRPIENLSSPSLSPTIQIVSSVNIIAEILRLTPLLSLSTRSSIDQVILSTAMRSGLPGEVVCGLHRAMVTSIRFPAGVAVLPHVIRILERDCTDDREIVRDSAKKGMEEIEGIVHPRLPVQLTPTAARQVEDDEEDEIGEGEIVEDIMTIADQTGMEESGQEIRDQQYLEQPHPESQEPPYAAVDISNVSSISVVPQPTLPSFVTEYQSQKQHEVRPPPESVLLTALSDQLQSESAIVMTAVKPMDAVDDVFSMGGWKSVQTENDEEDEIPEIDMGFDSDEE